MLLNHEGDWRYDLPAEACIQLSHFGQPTVRSCRELSTDRGDQVARVRRLSSYQPGTFYVALVQELFVGVARHPIGRTHPSVSASDDVPPLCPALPSAADAHESATACGLVWVGGPGEGSGEFRAPVYEGVREGNVDER